MNMKLELVPLPVKDIDTSIEFYGKLGFITDLDVKPADGMRVVQLTPKGSACSVTLTKGLPALSMPIGTLRGLHLVVEDIIKTREETMASGIKVDEIVNISGMLYAAFSDPDGNTWTFQEIHR